MATRGSYVHNCMVEFSGVSFMQFSQNIDAWFQTKRFTGLLELIQLYKQNLLENFFIFAIYQNYNTMFLVSSSLAIIIRTQQVQYHYLTMKDRKLSIMMLRTRRSLTLFNDVPLRTKSCTNAIDPYSNSDLMACMVLHGLAIIEPR